MWKSCQSCGREISVSLTIAFGGQSSISGESRFEKEGLMDGKYNYLYDCSIDKLS